MYQTLVCCFKKLWRVSMSKVTRNFKFFSEMCLTTGLIFGLGREMWETESRRGTIFYSFLFFFCKHQTTMCCVCLARHMDILVYWSTWLPFSHLDGLLICHAVTVLFIWTSVVSPLGCSLVLICRLFYEACGMRTWVLCILYMKHPWVPFLYWF